MKARLITFFLLCSMFFCTVQVGWTQNNPVTECRNTDPKKEAVYKKAFARFMDKARSQSFDRKEKQQIAEEYSELIDQMDALYHGAPQTRVQDEKYSVRAHTLAHAVVKVCKRDYDQ